MALSNHDPYPTIPVRHSCPIEDFTSEVSIEQRLFAIALLVYNLPFPRAFIDEEKGELVTVDIKRERLTPELLAERRRQGF